MNHQNLGPEENEEWDRNDREIWLFILFFSAFATGFFGVILTWERWFR